jgi:hypothetical protein
MRRFGQMLLGRCQRTPDDPELQKIPASNCRSGGGVEGEDSLGQPSGVPYSTPASTRNLASSTHQIGEDHFLSSAVASKKPFSVSPDNLPWFYRRKATELDPRDGLRHDAEHPRIRIGRDPVVKSKSFIPGLVSRDQNVLKQREMVFRTGQHLPESKGIFSVLVPHILEITAPRPASSQIAAVPLKSVPDVSRTADITASACHMDDLVNSSVENGKGLPRLSQGGDHSRVLVARTSVWHGEAWHHA